MIIEAYGLSDVGMKREKNEDSFLINNELGLFIVADGMGGHLGGEYASRMAVKTIEEIMGAIARDAETEILDDNGLSPNDFISHIKFSVQTASNRIFEEARRDAALRGMGTTTVMLLARHGRIYVANVGDSRGYLVRDGKITQLTQDHSLVGDQLRAGVITAGAARGHKLKNIITRSVGFQEEVAIDVVTKIPKKGDKFLLCSDGLSNMLEDEELLEVAADNGIREACHILVDIANERGGDDNITVLISEVTDTGPLGDFDDLDDETTMGI